MNIFNKIDFGIDMDSRICIVGPNGAGKTVRISFFSLFFFRSLLYSKTHYRVHVGNNTDSSSTLSLSCSFFPSNSDNSLDSFKTFDGRNQGHGRRRSEKSTFKDGNL